MGFEVERDYSAHDTLRLLAALHHGTDRVRFEADVDTGSTFCIFNRGHAESLGLDVESGSPARFATVTGSFDAFGHAVTLETLGYSFEVTVYFAAAEGFSRNVLGRRGWLDQVRLGIVEYENKMYLSRYGD
ncbi:MAG: aspartyl protease family protein [Pyrinomonadaceae bacterium]